MGNMLLKEKEKQKAPTRAHTTMNVLGGLLGNLGNQANKLPNIKEEKEKGGGKKRPDIIIEKNSDRSKSLGSSEEASVRHQPNDPNRIEIKRQSTRKLGKT